MIAETVAEARLTKPTRDAAYPGRRLVLVAEAKLYRLDGNERPHFSLTGSLDLASPGNRLDPTLECGCIHDRLLAAWPDLAVVAALHLSDDRGRPMHAAENMAYWLGFSRWNREPAYPGSLTPPDFAVAARHWRIAEDDARALAALVAEQAPDDPPARYEFAVARLAEVAEAEHAARWQAEADAALAFIRSIAGSD